MSKKKKEKIEFGDTSILKSIIADAKQSYQIGDSSERVREKINCSLFEIKSMRTIGHDFKIEVHKFKETVEIENIESINMCYFSMAELGKELLTELCKDFQSLQKLDEELASKGELLELINVSTNEHLSALWITADTNTYNHVCSIARQLTTTYNSTWRLVLNVAMGAYSKLMKKRQWISKGCMAYTNQFLRSLQDRRLILANRLKE